MTKAFNRKQEHRSRPTRVFWAEHKKKVRLEKGGYMLEEWQGVRTTL